MRSPIERQLAYFAEVARMRRVTAGIPVDESFADRLRARWPQRLASSLACGPGWGDLIEGLNEVLDMWGTELTFTDIKEKYGELRASYFGDDQGGRVDELMEAAEEISQSLCEVCGARAKVRQGPLGWISTTCDEHAPAHSKVIRVVSESRS